MKLVSPVGGRNHLWHVVTARVVATVTLVSLLPAVVVQVVRDLMDEQGLSAYWVIKTGQLPSSRTYRWLKGEYPIELAELEQAARILGVTVTSVVSEAERRIDERLDAAHRRVQSDIPLTDDEPMRQDVPSGVMPSAMTKTVMQAVRTRMELIGVTQAELARDLAVRQPTISRWLSGQAIPDMDQFAAIAHALRIAPEKLLLGKSK